MKKKEDEIIFNATYNPAHQCVKVFGDGSAEIKFDTDASQLASVLRSLATFKDSCFEVVLRKAKNDCKRKGHKPGTKIYR